MTTASKAALFRELYNLLAAALHRPDAEVLSADFVVSARELAERAGLPLDPEIEQIEALLQKNEVDLLRLQVEHSRLFLGPFALLASPYESIHRGQKAVMGTISQAVKRQYDEVGLEISEDFRDAPDHIVLELSYLSELCDQEHKAAVAGKTKIVEVFRLQQRRFLASHLLQWVRSFHQAVVAGASFDYYPAVSSMVALIAQAHYDYLSGRILSQTEMAARSEVPSS